MLKTWPQEFDLRERAGLNASSEALSTFLEEVNAVLGKGKDVSVRLNTTMINRPTVSNLGNPGPDPYTQVAASIEIPTTPGVPIVIDSVSMGECVVGNPIYRREQDAPDYQMPVRLKNCRLKTLQLEPGSRVILENTYVGYLRIRSTNYLEMNGGCVLAVRCPPASEPNPFRGEVAISGTYFPMRRFGHYLSGPQNYSNMRYHLAAQENDLMAAQFHAAELATQREQETLPYKILSYFYQWFSDFGNSALRPFLWLLVLLISSTAITTCLGGGVTVFGNDAVYRGYSIGLTYSGLKGEMARSCYLVFESAINPLHLFGLKTLVVPSNIWVVAWLSFQSILSLTLIALTIFAIRRRFKMRS